MSGSLIFKTERFCVSEFRESDRGAFLACHRDPTFSRFHQPDERSEKHLSAVFDLFLAWQRQDPRQNFQFAISKTDNDDGYVGNTGFRTSGLAAGACELGIELIPDVWHSGAATEILRAFLPWVRANHGIDTFIAETAPGNSAAERLATAFGMRATGQEAKRYWRLQVS